MACRRSYPDNRQSFTLVESLVAISLAALAGGAILAGSYAALTTAELSVRQAIAVGIAEQMMDEIYGSRYSEEESAPYSLYLGAELDEKIAGTRVYYDDVDDYHNLVCEPPVDRFGIPLGYDNGEGSTRPRELTVDSPWLSSIRIECRIDYVRKDDFRMLAAPGVATDYRAIEVQASYRTAGASLVPLCRLRRIAAYVPRL